MNERRLSIRNMIHLNVDLYHDDIGHIEGNIHDISSGGMRVKISKSSLSKTNCNHELFTVKPANMDVLFMMECLTMDKDFMRLKFSE